MAIQVNGTEVISNSRALNNIASVDATTATAIGAAGVGGSLEFISETNITSDVSYIDISFPTGYRNFHLQFNQMFTTNGQYANVADLAIQLKDSNGNLITGSQNYNFREYRLGTLSQLSYYQMGGIGPNLAQNAKRNVGLTTHVTIFNPRNANVQTKFDGGTSGRCTEYNDYALFSRMNTGNLFEASENIGCRVFAFSPGSKTISADSHSYTVWGIK
jgi:hypothetical protein